MLNNNTMRRRFKRIRRWILAWFLLCAFKSLQLVPVYILKVIAGVLGSFAFLLLREDRKHMLEHLRLAFPERSPIFRKQVGLAVIPNLGRAAVDTLEFQRSVVLEKKPKPDFKFDLDREMDLLLKKGGIVVTAHFGAWEILGGFFAKYYPGRLAVIAHRIYLPQVNDWIVNFRRSIGMKVFYLDESPRHYIRFLKEKNVLGILPDQDIKRMSGIFVPFFGRAAWTPTGPAVLALAAKVPIKCLFLIWDRGRYRLKYGRPFYPPKTGSREQQIRKLTEEWTHVLEETIRKYPEQWVWFHRRWRTRPK